ncbi:pantoate--beta-alanine ligase [Flavobacterium sp.]|uniref:pantoate--beta-alanine ligase n=1 Tax=Flavobacterium sp. TaxID=239 RepID=UPI00286AA1CE|nr:pantoate--beta-alanine ligase [Flavobacterium sp.]
MFVFNFNKTTMPVFYRKATFNTYLNSIKSQNSTLGFIPTMGALHLGHLSLMQQSLSENKFTVVSIFVNPTQFNNPVDLAKYPRTLESDLEKISNLNDQIIVYAPSVEDLYDGNPISQSFDFDGLENQMEGKFRPGHFDGVGTIVKRLFEVVNPTNAYFGEKDFQQLQIVKKMVQKNHLNVNVIGCPIYRESNNLAMSSRNELLTVQERHDASIIYSTLITSKEKFKTKSAQTVELWAKKNFEKDKTFKLEYFQIADEATLLPCLIKNKNKKYRAFIAVFVNNIRLIDTILLN